MVNLYVNYHAAQAQDNGAAGHQHSASNATAVDHLSCHSSSRTMMHLSKSCLEKMVLEQTQSLVQSQR